MILIYLQPLEKVPGNALNILFPIIFHITLIILSKFCFFSILYKHPRELAGNSGRGKMERRNDDRYENNRQELVSLRNGKTPVGCKWVVSLKYKATGQWRGTKIDWWLEVLHKHMELTIEKLFLLLLR